jgi:hypothetical protein
VPQAAEACQKSFGNPDFEAAVIGFEILKKKEVMSRPDRESPLKGVWRQN